MLSLDKLVTTAAAMDPQTLTMAAVAGELGVSTSALYRWVHDREALLDLVSATMVERILPGRAAGAADWQDWLTEWAHNVRREFGTVPGFAARVLSGPHRPASHEQLNQAGVRTFTTAGADAELAQQCWYVFSVAVLGWITAENTNLQHANQTPMDFDVLLQVLLRGSADAVRAAADS